LPYDKQLLESALLVVRWQRGDRDAFGGIVQLWERSLFFYLRRLTESEADAWELLQETWLKLIRSLNSLRDPYSLPAFLYATARNTAISRQRTQQCETENYPDQIPDDRSLNDLSAFEDADQVRHGLDRLPLAQREALTLFFLHDLSLEEIAALLDIPLGTVKSRIHYAKASLCRILSEGENDD
jgi:RNA polymerase sigma-70 factor, ECF subfamily